jgi:hypothetical protein
MTLLVLDHVRQESLKRPVMGDDVDAEQVIDGFFTGVQNGVLVSYL